MPNVCLRVIVPLAALGLAGCGLPPAPANMPPPLSAADLRPTTGDPYSGIIEGYGPATVASGAVERGGVLATIPYRYRHTAVLAEDVEGYSITVSGTRLIAGSPGYFAGNFGSTGMGGQTGRVTDMWCFFRGAAAEIDAGEETEPLCLLRNDSGIAAIAPTRLSPYLWTSFSPMTGSFDYVHTPIFVRQEVQLPVDLALEYRFDGWRDDAPQVEVYIRDKRVQTLRARDDGKGSMVINTIAGELAFARPAPGSENVSVALR